MVDRSDKGSESEDMSSQTPTADRVSSDYANGHVKTCADCGTSKTPLWRGGPAGPKSLCNACGIRSRKKIRALMGLNKEDKKAKRSSLNGQKNISRQNSSSSGSKSTNISGDNSCSSNNMKKASDLPKKKVLSFGRDATLQRPRSSSNQRRKMGEEEQAAFLLMALSCGAVFA